MDLLVLRSNCRMILETSRDAEGRSTSGVDQRALYNIVRQVEKAGREKREVARGYRTTPLPNANVPFAIHGTDSRPSPIARAPQYTRRDPHSLVADRSHGGGVGCGRGGQVKPRHQPASILCYSSHWLIVDHLHTEVSRLMMRHGVWLAPSGRGSSGPCSHSAVTPRW